MTPLTQLNHQIFKDHNVQVWIKREDQNHPEIQGNKLYKLLPNLHRAMSEHKSPVISFGGPYSNHIAALAAAGKMLALETIGYIRGDELKNHPEKWSLTLTRAHENGMNLKFITRKAYRQKCSENHTKMMLERWPNGFIIPEGGTNELAVNGFKPLCLELENQIDWDILFTPVGTGGTLSGLISHSHYKENRCIYGVSSLKGGDFLKEDVRLWVDKAAENKKKLLNAWHIKTDYHCGGYAKKTPALLDMTSWFEAQFNLPLDPVYTSKMIFAFMDMLNKGEIPAGSKVVLLHTGGLQGRLS